MNSVSKNVNIKICQYTVSRADFSSCHLNIAPPLQQRLHELASMLRSTYITRLVTLFPGYKFQILILKFEM
jgi:hypothetical protein